MASEADTSSAQIDPQMVGNSFVEQYYKALHQYPEHLHRFYQDSSFLNRPGPDGIVIMATTMKGINDQILSLEYQNYQTEILTVDAQGSYCGGVHVLVTGFLTGQDSGKRKFTQSFFLAPQENGFYVLNDMFRFVDDDMAVGMPINLAHLQVDDHQTAPIAPPPSVAADSEPVAASSQSMPDHTTPATTAAVAAPSPEVTTNNIDKEVSENLLPNHVAENHSASNLTTTTTLPEAITNNAKPEISIHEQLQNEKDLNIPENKTVVADHHPVVSNQNGAHTLPETSTPRSPDSKKSFASIVNALKDNSAPFQVRVPPPTFRKPPSNGTKATDAFASNGLKRNNEDQVAAKTFTIFVANLPMDVTADQIKEIFIKFGPIKPNGIRIRNNQLRPNCFCFIEYDSAPSMQNALRASPLAFGDRKVYVEEKKGGNDPAPVRRNPTGYQNENFRSRVNSNGRINPQAAAAAATATAGPRYYQNDSGRGQKVTQNEAGRVGRQGQAEKKSTSSVVSSKSAARTARK